MKRLDPVDVVIAGGGWTGLAIARELTQRTSLSVVVLERGPERKFSSYASSMDEVDYAIRKRMMQNIAEETITHRHSVRDRAAPVRQYGGILPGTGVGGSGEHWTGYSERHAPDDFQLATRLREKWGASHLPAELSVQDFPLSYDDLEPYYWKVEQMLGISGKAGNIRGEVVEGGNPFEGPRSHEYPNPPHKKTYAMVLFEQATRELGYHPYPAAAATLSQQYTNPDGVSRAGCQYCGYCMLYGCMVAAKAQPTNTLMPVLRRSKNFVVRPGCWVRRIVHRDGVAEGVTYMDDAGQEVFQPASLVIASSFSTNNARLLMLSRIGSLYDPVTGKGTLGRNFTHTVQGGGNMLLFNKPLNSFMYAGAQASRISDFEGFNNVPSDAGILRGGICNTNGGTLRAIGSFGRVFGGGLKRNWGSEWKKTAVSQFDHVASFASFEMDHLAYKQNFVDLDPTYSDKWGDPLLRLTLNWTEHEARQQAFARKMSDRIARQIAKISGATIVGADTDRNGASPKYQTVTYATTHVQGGAIMGTSPENSVVNTWLQHWNVSNLFVLGASAFPQNAASHPTLTALALTLRAADAIIDRYLKKQGQLA